MAAPLLHLKDIRLGFGGSPLLDGAELAVAPRDRLCLVGRNGSGKSTLLKIAAGLIEPDSGTRFAQPGAAIRYLPQEPDLSGHASTRAYVESGLVEGDDPNRAFYLLGSLGLSGEEEPSRLSGGEARRAALARVLAPRPDVLLLDEPTNHLDLPAIEWLEEELAAMAGALVLISHDRRFLERLSRATIWLDRGQSHRLERSFVHFEAWRDEKLAQEEVERHKLERRIAAEEHWLRYGVSARRKRNVGRLERLKGMRTERREQLRALGNVRMEAAEGAGGGTKVIDAKGVGFAYGDGLKEIVRDFSLRIHRGNRIGVVGPNGAGKTTLLKLLTGALAPQKGNVKLGQGLLMAQLDQGRGKLHPEQSLAAAVTDGSGDTVMVAGKPRHVMNYLQDFLFAPAQARAPVKVLSGGERARLLLAKLFATPSNFLVLDEPTNDLDLETLDLLEEVIADYPGTALIVSHDRDFLDRVATSLVAAEGDGRFVEYAGGYSDMLAQREPKAEPARAKAPKKEAAERPRKERPAKMNFSDAHALKTLPEKIAAAEAEIAALEAGLSDAGLYARDPARFAELSRTLAELRAAKDADEERWLALEMRREELEQR